MNRASAQSAILQDGFASCLLQGTCPCLISLHTAIEGRVLAVSSTGKWEQPEPMLCPTPQAKSALCNEMHAAQQCNLDMLVSRTCLSEEHSVPESPLWLQSRACTHITALPFSTGFGQQLNDGDRLMGGLDDLSSLSNLNDYDSKLECLWFLMKIKERKWWSQRKKSPDVSLWNSVIVLEIESSGRDF